MRNLRYPPKASLDGPWLLSSKSLKELDVIVTEHWKRFELRRKTLLKRDVDDFRKTVAEPQLAETSGHYSDQLEDRISRYRKGSPLSKSHRGLEIDLKDGTVSSYQNFEEVFRDRYLLDKRPTSFRIELYSGDIEFYMTVDSSGMNFELEPPDESSEVQEIYTTIYEWAREIQRNVRFQVIWGKIAKQRWKMLIAGLVLPILFSFTTRASGSGDIQQQLFRLYDQGITSRNMADAVNLLIQLQKAEQFTTLSFHIAPWLMIYLGIYAYLAMVLFIRPKVELDIGKGRNAIQFWGLWQWVVLSPIVLLVGDVLRPSIADLVKNLLSSIR